MSSQLKKEFKKADVERMRNLVRKDYTAGTKSQTGYKKTFKDYKEGDVWEENNKKWTIKDGIKQNVTKFDSAKKAVKIPLCCPKCNGPLSLHLSKETYKKSNMCFDCYISFVGELKRSGHLDQYLRAKQKGNAKYFIKAMEELIVEVENDIDATYVTEHGDIESWKSNSKEVKNRYTKELKETISFLKTKLD